jgi:hypothetical protein
MTPDSDYARTDTYPGHISPLFGAPANIGHRLLVVMELIIRRLQSGQFRIVGGTLQPPWSWKFPTATAHE